MENEVHRTIGQHDAQIEALQKQVAALHADMTGVLNELRTINSTLSEAKGGWRMLLAVGGLAATVGAMVAKGVALLFGAR